MIHTLKAGPDDIGRRVDRFLRKTYPKLPLSAVHKIIRSGKIKIDSKKVSASDRISESSKIELFGLEAPTPIQTTLNEITQKKNLPILDILYQNERFLVINKKEGQVMHGEDSLDEAVQKYLLNVKVAPHSYSFKSGPLHRLDQGSSGIVFFSVNLEGAQVFSEASRKGMLKKTYLAILEGVIENTEVWEDFIQRDTHTKSSAVVENDSPEAKFSRTYAQPIINNSTHTLCMLVLDTGRTHQIRVQASKRGHPLLGDRKYGSKIPQRFLLHAWRLSLPPELFYDLPPEIIAPLSQRFLTSVNELFGIDIETALKSGIL